MSGPYIALSQPSLVTNPLYVERPLFWKTFRLTRERERAHEFDDKAKAFAAIASLEMSFRFVVEDLVTQQVFA